jgi:hypothetical protein
MASEWSELASKHWVVGGILVSLLWFFAGKLSLSNGRPDAALFWQSHNSNAVLLDDRRETVAGSHLPCWLP